MVPIPKGMKANSETPFANNRGLRQIYFAAKGAGHVREGNGVSAAQLEELRRLAEDSEVPMTGSLLDAYPPSKGDLIEKGVMQERMKRWIP